MSGFLVFVFLLLLTVLSFFYQQWHAGFASSFLFMIFLLLAIYEGLVSITMFNQLQAERWIEKKRLYAGQTQRMTIKLTRKFRIPFVWYAVHDPKLDQFSGVLGQIIFPWFRQEWEMAWEIPAVSRGSYELSQLRIVSGDIFGLFKRTKIISIPDCFVVLPSYDHLTNWSAEDSQRNGQTSVAKRIAEEWNSVAGIRDYRVGDRLSQIHWKASARGQGLMTREFEQRKANQIAILLDTHRQSYSKKEEFEKAVCLAASFAHFGCHHKMKYSFWREQRGQIMLTEGTDGQDFYRIMEELAVIQREGLTAFAVLVQQALMRIPKGTQLIIITSKLDSATSMLLLELAMKKWKVEACLVSKPSTSKEREWIQRMQGSGVNCYREMA